MTQRLTDTHRDIEREREKFSDTYDVLDAAAELKKL